MRIWGLETEIRKHHHMRPEIFQQEWQMWQFRNFNLEAIFEDRNMCPSVNLKLSLCIRRGGDQDLDYLTGYCIASGPIPLIDTDFVVTDIFYTVYGIYRLFFIW